MEDSTSKGVHCRTSKVLGRPHLLTAGINKTVKSLISRSWRKGTSSSYNSKIRSWIVYANKVHINMFKPDLCNILNYLGDLYSKGLSYSHINGARSALSSFIFLSGKPCGQHPTVIRLLKGIFNQRPALRMDVIWEVQPVLDSLRSLSPAKLLSTKQLLMKIVILLSLITGQRQQWLAALDIRNIIIKNKKCASFSVGDIMKTTRPSFHQSQITVKAYAPDRRLCIVTYLEEYLARTKLFRKHNNLFLITQRPFTPAAKGTIANWIRSGLIKLGVDMKIFKPHSIRSASTSKLKINNIPIKTILKSAGWSNSSTFTKYYNKTPNTGDMDVANLM